MRFLLIVLSTVFLFSSCHFVMGERVSGNGHVTSQDRSVGDFNEVRLSGSMDLHVTQGPSGAVKVEADDNLLQYIDIRVEGHTLIVREKDGYDLHPSKDMAVYVTAPSFTSIDVSGSGNIISDNTISATAPLRVDVSGSGNINMTVDVPKLSTDISGSGNIVLKGQAADLDVSMSGSGSANCFGLVSDNVSIDISGSSDADVTANKKLDIHVSGSGNVRYKGNAAVSQSVSGSGGVQKAG